MVKFDVLQDTRLYTNQALNLTRGSLGVGTHEFEVLEEISKDLVKIDVFGKPRFLKLSDTVKEVKADKPKKAKPPVIELD